MGGVIHTLNPRLFDEQLVYIANHAEDRILFYDKAFQPIVDRLKPQWTSIEHYICFDPSTSLGADNGGDQSFEALIAPYDGDYQWVEGPEREPCMLCYTSGTTGNPKGVLYEHRSSVIHAMAEVAPSCFDLAPNSVALPIVPMFHAAAWGLPFAGAMAGIKFVYSTVNDPAVLCKLMNEEKVTHSAGVPTVWLAMFQYMDATGKVPEHLKIVTIGGSAAPRAMIERLMKMGIRVGHAWGMTRPRDRDVRAPPADWDEMASRSR
jgi:fatty-acyl-CoA synthase